MKSVNNTLSIITPIFLNSVGGASVYYRALSDSFVKKGIDVNVFSEIGGDSQSPSKVKLRWLLPFRSNLAPKSILNIVLYFVQNISYVSLLFRLPSNSIVLVHSSFLNYPGSFFSVVKLLSLMRPELQLILDVRDNLMPLSRRGKLSVFDKIICCSEKIFKDFSVNESIESKLVLIPIPLEESVVASFGSDVSLPIFFGGSERYIFYAGTLKESKNIHVLINAFLKRVLPVAPNVKLVLAGELKSSKREILDGLESDSIFHLGPLPNKEIQRLIQGASLCVNLSENEGLPRFSLEVVRARVPLVFASGVLEFDRYCAPFSIANVNEEKVSEKILEVLDECSFCSDYPIERHFMQNVLQSYLAIFNNS